MSTLAILLSAFVLSVVALLVFIGSQRSGLFERNAEGAAVIFASGEIGTVEDPSASPSAHASLQAGTSRAAGGQVADRVPDEELLARVRADASTASLVFFFFLLCIHMAHRRIGGWPDRIDQAA